MSDHSDDERTPDQRLEEAKERERNAVTLMNRAETMLREVQNRSRQLEEEIDEQLINHSFASG